MKKTSKRLFCLMLSLALIVGILPVMAMAAETPVKATITTGTPIGDWEFNRVGTTAGIGPEKSYDDSMTTQWNPQAYDGLYDGGEGIVYTLDKEYDVTKITLTFMRKHYFQVLVSNDGVNYDVYATVTADNETKYMTVVDESVADKPVIAYNFGFGVNQIKYVKVLFNGNIKKNQWISLYDINVQGTASVQAAAGVPVIVRGETIGQWNELQTGTSNSVFSSYDNSASSMWNPGAMGNFAGDPGVIYTLKNAARIEKMEFNFGANTDGTRTFYFDVFVSVDGATYTPVAEISAKNETKAYPSGTGLCVLDGLSLDNVKYVKVIFRERKVGADYVSLLNVALSNEGTAGADTSWMLPVVASAEPVGAWLNDQAGTAQSVEKAFDGDAATQWNPGAGTNFADEPGVVFTLTRAMDLQKMQFDFGTLQFYFDLYAKAIGTEFEKIADISAVNEGKAYTGTSGICTIDGLNLQDVTHVKLVFKGRKGGGTWLTLKEVIFSENGTAGMDTSWLLPCDGRVNIESAALSGTWASSGETALGRSYDDDLTSLWNPGANTGYAGQPGMIYTLAQKNDLRGLELAFTTRYVYFDVSVSADGITYVPAVSVNANNYANYYKNGYICTIDGLSVENAKYVKITFTGDSDNKCWVSLYEVSFNGDSTESETVYAAIDSAEPIGTWTDDRVGKDFSPEETYDDSMTSLWNPNASSIYFEDGEGIVYTLDQYYDISKISLTFMRHHYFTLLVSGNGINYTEICSVDAVVAPLAYQVLDNSVAGKPVVQCIMDVNMDSIKYVKVLFAGHVNNNSFISMYDTQVQGVVSEVQEFICTHENQTTTTVDATCAAEGSVTVTCDDCGEVISTETIPATGDHNMFDLVDKGDGTHNVVCYYCGEILSNAPHTYNSVSAANQTGSCNCGHTVFAWAGMSVSLESSLQATFVVQTSKLPAEGYYAVVEKEVFDKTSGEISVETTRFEAADFVNYNTAGTMKKIVFSGVAAKQMTDRFTVTIYNADDEQISASYTRTIEEYILSLFSNAKTSEAMKVVAVDFLNYGAAAQDKFGYRTTELANRGLTDELKALATADSAVADVTDDRTKDDMLAGTAVAAEYEIIPAFVYQTSKLTNVVKAEVSYVNFKGETVSYEVAAADFANYNDAGTMKKIEIKGTAVADGASPITVKLIDADGNVLDESIECVNFYCARMAADHAVFTQLLKVIYSAKVAFA